MRAGRAFAPETPASLDQRGYEFLTQTVPDRPPTGASWIQAYSYRRLKRGCRDKRVSDKLCCRAFSGTLAALLILSVLASRQWLAPADAKLTLGSAEQAVFLASGSCGSTFVAPPPPAYATKHNGVQLPDVCFSGNGPNKSNHVFIIGDWGGVYGSKGLQPADARGRVFGAKHRQFVFGADDWAQQRVAEQMAKRALSSNPDYVINVGDNFYWGGIGTSNDKSVYGFGEGAKCGALPPNVPKPSAQFKLIFEDVYKGQGLDGKAWLGVLGNHDYGGWMFTAAWDQAIGYTWLSNRWMTPAQYWRVTVRYTDVVVDWYFYDTNFADAGMPGSGDEHNICGRAHNKPGANCPLTGPHNVSSCYDWFQKLKDDEFMWLEDSLSKSTAHWQILVTHFPTIYYIGNATRLADRFGVDLFISGHVHMQTLVGEHEQPAFLSGCPYAISGGGGGITSEAVPDANGQDDQYGFMDMTISAEEIKIEAISHGGILRNTKVIHPRSVTTTTTATTATVSTTTQTSVTQTTSTQTQSTTTTTTRTSITSTSTSQTSTTSTTLTRTTSTVTATTRTSSTSTQTTRTATTKTKTTSTRTTSTATSTATETTSTETATATTTSHTVTSTDTATTSTTTTTATTSTLTTTDTTTTRTSTYSVKDLSSWARSGKSWAGFGRPAQEITGDLHLERMNDLTFK